MKFKNKETGEIYDIYNDSMGLGFCKNVSCILCPLVKANPELEDYSIDCRDWIEEHPKETAELMGHELITDPPEESVEPQEEAPEMVSREEVTRDLRRLQWSVECAIVGLYEGKGNPPYLSILRSELEGLIEKYQPNSCPLCSPGGVIYRTVKGKNGALKGLCGTVDELNFCPGCGKPLNDKGRQIQKETLDCAAEAAAKSV